MKKYWWKAIGVLLLVYVIIGGLKTPLSPGIFKINQTEIAKANQVFSFEIVGYNTHFQEANTVDAWYTNNFLQKGEAFSFSSVEVLNDTLIKVSGTIPQSLGTIDQHLFLQTDNDGTMSFISAFQVLDQKGEVNKSEIIARENIEISNGFSFPYREQLYETIRNLLFHVPMWFAMMLLSTISVVYSIKFLNSGNINDDIVANQTIKVALLFAVLGMLTGSLWAKFTWGAWWVVEDVKLNGAAVSSLIYLAYLILRSSVNEESKRGRLAAIYNIFAYVMMMVFLMILPRMLDTLHPGNGGNPAFSQYDLDSSLRAYFYPAVIGWIIIGIWISEIQIRREKLTHKIAENE